MKRYICQTSGQLKDSLQTYRPHTKQQEQQEIKIEKLVNIYRQSEVKVFPFKVKLYKNLLQESYNSHL